MINRLLEKEIEVVSEENAVGYKSPIKLSYYLLECDTGDNNEVVGEKVYGIEIVKKVDSNKEELEFIKNLSCCREITMSILDKLAQNTVTPVGLPFILDDMLGV